MKVKVTADDGGKYHLFVDGKQVSQHVQEREAMEAGLNALLEGATEVYFMRKGRVTLVLDEAPPTEPEPEPEPEPDPPTEPPVEPDPPAPGEPVEIEWLGSTNVSTADPRAEGVPAPPSGADTALRFLFHDKPNTGDAEAAGVKDEDGWAEQRVGFGKKLRAFTARYNLFVPENYHHRKPVSGASNNKFFRIWASDARFALTIETMRRAGGTSALERLKTQSRGEHRGIADGQGQGVEPWWSARQTGPDLIGPGMPIEPGTWTPIEIEFASASARDQLDGYLRLKAHGKLVREWKWSWWADAPDADGNSDGGDPGQPAYIDMCYILGWANSGFDEETICWVDDFQVTAG